jgi:GNAT superfamily N-acetyltransferase
MAVRSTTSTLPKIERATPRDRRDVATLYHQAWRQTHGTLEPAAVVADRDEGFFQKRVAAYTTAPRLARAADGTVLGFVAWDGFLVQALFLAEIARGSGLGARLLAEAEFNIAAAGHDKVALICIVGNDRARRFYERQGYRVTLNRNIRAQTTQGEVVIKAWRMQKRLVPVKQPNTAARRKKGGTQCSS